MVLGEKGEFSHYVGALKPSTKNPWKLQNHSEGHSDI